MGQVSTPIIWHARGEKDERGEESIKGRGNERGDRKMKRKTLYQSRTNLVIKPKSNI